MKCMSPTKGWNYVPLRLAVQWREIGEAGRRLHPVYYYVWLVIGFPIMGFSYVCYLLALMLAPTFMLGSGLIVVNYNPGGGWFVYAGIVGLLWNLWITYRGAMVVGQIRQRTLDLERIAEVFFMFLGNVVAGGLVPFMIAEFESRAPCRYHQLGL